MKYPAIYKSVEGSEYLYQNKDSYYCYERQVWDSSEPHHDCHHSDKNITPEYLANTYGEVKSKEHAEFIVKLAEVNGLFTISNEVDVLNAKSFMFYGDRLGFHSAENAKLTGKKDKKQITIPLPPEHENVDEWPKVGDDAEICESPAFELSVKSSKFIGKKGIVRAKFENSDGVMVYVLEVDTENVFCFYLQNIKKPKTPEQELRELLHLLWRENNEDFDDFADIAVLHLKKKGEGDE